MTVSDCHHCSSFFYSVRTLTCNLFLHLNRAGADKDANIFVTASDIEKVLALKDATEFLTTFDKSVESVSLPTHAQPQIAFTSLCYLMLFLKHTF